MSSMQRGGRARVIVAIVVSTFLVTGAGIALWPRTSAEASAVASDPHSEHVTAVVSGSDAANAASGTSAAAGAESPAGSGKDAAASGKSPTASASPKPPPRSKSPVVPPKSKSAGNSPQTSLGSAATSKPAKSGAKPGGKVSLKAVAKPPKRDGAAGLGNPRPDVKPADVIDPDAALGGCNDAYGEDGQCLPSIPPSQAEHAAEMVEAGLDPSTMPHPWTCPEVREYFADGIAVRMPGVDPDGLDRDGNGIACEPD